MGSPYNIVRHKPYYEQCLETMYIVIWHLHIQFRVQFQNPVYLQGAAAGTLTFLRGRANKDNAYLETTIE